MSHRGILSNPGFAGNKGPDGTNGSIAIAIVDEGTDQRNINHEVPIRLADPTEPSEAGEAAQPALQHGNGHDPLPTDTNLGRLSDAELIKTILSTGARLRLSASPTGPRTLDSDMSALLDAFAKVGMARPSALLPKRINEGMTQPEVATANNHKPRVSATTETNCYDKNP
jgi:hypothetical protein